MQPNLCVATASASWRNRLLLICCESTGGVLEAILRHDELGRLTVETN